MNEGRRLYFDPKDGALEVGGSTWNGDSNTQRVVIHARQSSRLSMRRLAGQVKIQTRLHVKNVVLLLCWEFLNL